MSSRKLTYDEKRRKRKRASDRKYLREVMKEKQAPLTDHSTKQVKLGGDPE